MESVLSSPPSGSAINCPLSGVLICCKHTGVHGSRQGCSDPTSGETEFDFKPKVCTCPPYTSEEVDCEGVRAGVEIVVSQHQSGGENGVAVLQLEAEQQ
jgi:hypothetical protein